MPMQSLSLFGAEPAELSEISPFTAFYRVFAEKLRGNENLQDHLLMPGKQWYRQNTPPGRGSEVLLAELRAEIKPTNQEQFAWSLKDQKYRKQLLKHWSKKQIENDTTLFNFIKKNRV